ncbi:hypothetical protein GW17_00032859 [Ensete ventricosum]|nr:hypothetical protein GW17_00032859 [Ensete ventricosum]
MRCRLVLPSPRTGRRGDVVPFSFLASSPRAGRRKPTSEESPVGDGSHGEPGKIKYLPFLLLPLLLSPSIDHRRSKSTVDDRFQRYRPVASGSRTDILSHRHVLLVSGDTERNEEPWYKLRQ